MISGTYYFLTLTSSPNSPLIAKTWNNLRQWLNRYHPSIAYCYAITSEGYGVIHMVIRFENPKERIDAKILRNYWQATHQATQLKIVKVTQSKAQKLANYIADQRRLRGLGTEMAFQNELLRWRYNRRWLPVGFSRQFGRYYQKARYQNNIPQPGVEQFCRLWIRECHEKGIITLMPMITKGCGDIE